ncbi:MAG: DUF3035 domain-containing protein [Parvularculaceae bacterium]
MSKAAGGRAAASKIFLYGGRVAALAIGAVALSLASGCSGFGAALGGGKNPPDEFAIATRAPLVVPPDFALRPPRPGEARPQERSASDRAQQVLLGDANAAPPSTGEQVLLQKVGAFEANPNIRETLDAENGKRAEKEASFANQLMFWQFLDGEVDDSAAPLQVDDPAAWLAAREKAIKAVTGEEGEVEIKKDRALGLPGIF